MIYVERKEYKEYTEDFIRLFINEDDLFDKVSAWINLSRGYGMMVDLLEDDLTVSEIIDEIGEDGEIYEISSSDDNEIDIFIYKINDKNYMFAIKNQQALVIWNR